ncbi:MAG: molybdopterin-dependent oxidoreductase [Dehalococcoidales bacterium]|nr:molybdopterin-dependent oxidoreductase [Dehalococcoidales bacterium]
MKSDSENKSTGDTTIIRGAACYDCGGRCPLKFHVKDGKIIRIEGDDAVESEQLRACLRCRAYRQYVYHPDRLKYPMKRVGARGEGRFARISWDEALDTVAGELKRVKETYGNAGIFFMAGGGYHGSLHSGRNALPRLLSLFGGFSTNYGNISSEGCVWAVMAQYGTVYTGNSRSDLVNSKLIIMWGWDPVKMISGTDCSYNLMKAREAGARFVAVDPRLTQSAATLAHQWVPIRPGTDTAMLVSMAYVMIKENLQDQKFLDKYTVGFDKFRDYVTGREDGIAKTTEWAEAITGVPAAVIMQLAREYATVKPAALMDGMGPARSAMGEQFTRCAMTLAAMTGNIGIAGGSAGGGLMNIPIGHMFRAPNIGIPRNPLEAGGKSVRGSLDLQDRLIARVHSNKIFDCMLSGKAGGYPFDIKFLWSCQSNYLNQLGNTNKSAKAMHMPEFIVIDEIVMTPTARFADVILPVNTPVEKNDIVRPWPSGPYFLHVNKVIEPLYETKSSFQIACELAPRLGIDNYNDKTEEQWLRAFVKMAPDMAQEITDYDKFKKEGIHRIKLEKPIIAFEKEIADPEHNPFPTPSGKIEIFSRRVAEIGSPGVPPVPKYLDTWESRNDPLVAKYPLQMVSPHPAARAHSTLYLVPWLREAHPSRVWLNTRDAAARGIRDEDEVMVFNDRGKTVIPAWVTNRIMPGVIAMEEGAWFTPDAEGVDRGGCPNVLTRDEYSPGGATAMNTVLVEVKKV